MKTRSALTRLTLLPFLLASATCGGDGNGPASLTPEATGTPRSPAPETSRTVLSPTPEASSTPGGGCELEPAACQFVADVAAYVAARDAAGIVDLAEPRTFTCPGAITSLGGPFPLCEGQPQGTALPGVFLTIPQIGGALSTDQLFARLADAFASARSTVSDGYGDGTSRVVSYAYRLPDPRYGEAVAVVMTWIAPAPDWGDLDPATGTRRFVAAIVGTPTATGAYGVIEYSRSLDFEGKLGLDLISAGGVAKNVPRFDGYTFRPWK